MIKFKKINENNLKQIQKHTKESEYLVCDLSAGVIYMWDKVYNPEYAVFNQTLIIKCNFKNIFGVCIFVLCFFHLPSNQKCVTGRRVRPKRRRVIEV